MKISELGVMPKKYNYREDTYVNFKAYEGYNRASEEIGNKEFDPLELVEFDEEKFRNMIYKIRTNYSPSEAQPGGCNTIAMLEADRIAKAIIANKNSVLKVKEIE